MVRASWSGLIAALDVAGLQCQAMQNTEPRKYPDVGEAVFQPTATLCGETRAVVNASHAWCGSRACGTVEMARGFYQGWTAADQLLICARVGCNEAAPSQEQVSL